MSTTKIYPRVPEVTEAVPAVALFADTDAQITVAALMADYGTRAPEIAGSLDTILRIWGPEQLSSQLDVLTDAGVHGLEKLADRLATDYVEDVMSTPSPAPLAA